ncbi:MAG: LysM domain-containing protein [Dehalococcoidia bacterium]
MVDCYYCDAEAVQECPRCGALYCENHGEALCVRCQDPALALPSYRVYRGSLAALLVGTLLAVWLLLTPQSSTDADSPPASLSGLIETPTATATASSTAVAAGPTPTGTATSTASATATATATATPTETTTPGDIEYTVGPGETLFSIAEQYVPPGVEVLTFVDQIVAYNGIVDPSTIAVGQVLLIPQ